ncbi:hypothetical protein V7148_21570 [Gottfriedia acidiceleris]|uniref:hypothetical protein n=1 Tax=Gottfriedia acidiceleris TaxID=371036 RepID=UPI002FFFB2B0
MSSKYRIGVGIGTTSTKSVLFSITVLLYQAMSSLMNTQGYMSTSITPIIEKNGMEKGGIYNHF